EQPAAARAARAATSKAARWGGANDAASSINKSSISADQDVAIGRHSMRGRTVAMTLASFRVERPRTFHPRGRSFIWVPPLPPPMVRVAAADADDARLATAQSARPEYHGAHSARAAPERPSRALRERRLPLGLDLGALRL